MVVIFVTCAHTLAHSELSALKKKKVFICQGKLNIKNPLEFRNYRQLCPHDYKAIAESFQGSRIWEKKNLGGKFSGIAELSI